MSDKKKKFDEQTLARVLEAAYVLQEHQHELEEFKSGLDSMRKSAEAESVPTAAVAPPSAVPVAPIPAPSIESSPLIPPAPIASTPEVSSPVVSASEVFPAASSPAISVPEFLPLASSPDVTAPEDFSPVASIAPVALPTPLTILPVPETVAAKGSESILEQVMETQHQAQVQKLDLDAEMSLIAGQVIEICGAAGAAIGILNRRTVCYRSVAGIRTLPAGSEVSVDEALCAPCLQSGEIWRCADTNSKDIKQHEECRHRGIGSLIAAPLFHEGRSVGALELLFSDPNAFTEQDVQACQMMAGIVTESLSRDPGLRWKDAPVAKPALTTGTAFAQEAVKERAVAETAEAAETTDAAEAAESYQCKCGHVLLGGEQFCGECGTPRAGDYEPASMQSKVASLWHMQESKKLEPSAHLPLDDLSTEPVHDAPQLRMTTSILNPPDRSRRTGVPHFGLHDAETNNGKEQPQATAPVESPAARPATESDAPAPLSRTNKALEDLISPPPAAVQADWSSATSARDFLEQVADGQPQNVLLRLWNTRRGDIYLAVAVVLVLCVIRWGMWPSHPTSPQPAAPPAAAGSQTSSAPRKAVEPDLSLSERMLIALGLADAPDPPTDKGNPSTQVWVDLHTALYYCPGADLYGKTATGKYTTQREAELDQFQPAYRKTCN